MRDPDDVAGQLVGAYRYALDNWPWAGGLFVFNLDYSASTWDNEYARLFGVDGARLKKAKPDVLLLAPGPINRGVEITPEVADGPHSAILDQVTNGLAVRMAVLALVCGRG